MLSAPVSALTCLCWICCCTSMMTTVTAGPAYKPDKPLADVPFWTNANAEWFQQAELSATSDYYVRTVNARPSFGIALSGGGYRATTLALGYMRALHRMNFTRKARYTSSNSGGTWFNAAFTYQAVMPVEDFLGLYVPPEQLTMKALRDVRDGAQGSFARVISSSSIIAYGLSVAVADASSSIDSGPGAWSLSVGRAFLRPYNLDSDTSTLTVNGTQGPINAALQQLPGIDVYTYQAEFDAQAADNKPRPFPIILGTIYDRLANASSIFFPLEFTPMYIGCPAVYINPDNPNQTVGGGYVGVQGFNSMPPNPVPTVPAPLAATLGDVPAVTTISNATEPVTRSSRVQTRSSGSSSSCSSSSSSSSVPTGRRHRHLLQDIASETGLNSSNSSTISNSESSAQPAAAAGGTDLNSLLPLQTAVESNYILPLKSVVGISSSFLAQGLRPEGAVLQELTGTETLDYWNQVNFTGARWQFADGGGTDNLAVTPLLRRRVKAIVACVAAVDPITGNMNASDWASVQWDIAGLFGAVPIQHPAFAGGRVPGTGMTPQQLNKATQVFPTAGYAELFQALQASVAAGGPAFHLASYKVQSNPYQAIHGGWQVAALWVVNALQSSWEAHLPAEVQGMLAKSRTLQGGLFQGNLTVESMGSGVPVPELRMFPYISTFDANYGSKLTGLLSQLATWQMLQLKPHLEQLIKAADT